MMTRFAWAVAALAAAVGFLLGLVANSPGVSPSGTGAGLGRHEDRSPLVVSSGAVAEGDGPVDFAAVAAKVNPAVVNVDAAARGRRGGGAICQTAPRRHARAPAAGS